MDDYGVPFRREVSRWRAPDGTGWRVMAYGHPGGSPTKLRELVQNPDTRRWHCDYDQGRRRSVPREEFEATYVPIEREPWRDVRITRLGELVNELLAEFADATGAPAGAAEQIAQALHEVEAVPEEMRRAGFRAGRQAGRRAR